ncbi:hypothetical protein AB0N79_19980 [Streptomyces microflavus]|uniref:DUF7683 domain-containing protein n=1 Tax=Streptomyces microflavus TaxID=1919 RepID=UPI00341300DB
MTFVISSYEKDSDRPDSEVDVSEVPAEAFAEILGMGVERLTDVYPLDESHVHDISRLTGLEFDLSTHEYFLESLAD